MRKRKQKPRKTEKKRIEQVLEIPLNGYQDRADKRFARVLDANKRSADNKQQLEEGPPKRQRVASSCFYTGK